MEAETPVSIHETVTVLPVKISTGVLVKLVKVNDHVVGVWLISLVVMTNPVVSEPIVRVQVIVSLYQYLVSSLTCRVSPLLTVHVVALSVTQLMIRDHDVVAGSKLKVTGTVMLSTLAVDTLVVYQVFNCAIQLDWKEIFSG